jgi:hypothetical protein
MAKQNKQQPKDIFSSTIPIGNTKEGSFFKSFILTIITLVFTFILFSLPLYNAWFKGQIKGYYTEYKKQKKNLDIHTRWEQRHGYDLIIPEYLVKQLDTTQNIFLLPPTEYLKKNNVGYNWNDARWLYYMTEVKIPKRYLSDSNFRQATHTLIASEQGLNLVALSDSSIWKQTLERFKQ